MNSRGCPKSTEGRNFLGLPKLPAKLKFFLQKDAPDGGGLKSDYDYFLCVFFWWDLKKNIENVQTGLLSVVFEKNLSKLKPPKM